LYGIVLNNLDAYITVAATYLILSSTEIQSQLKYPILLTNETHEDLWSVLLDVYQLFEKKWKEARKILHQKAPELISAPPRDICDKIVRIIDRLVQKSESRDGSDGLQITSTMLQGSNAFYYTIEFIRNSIRKYLRHIGVLPDDAECYPWEKIGGRTLNTSYISGLKQGDNLESLKWSLAALLPDFDQDGILSPI
jgi:hypothetical protein